MTFTAPGVFARTTVGRNAVPEGIWAELASLPLIYPVPAAWE
jgi:hypothetical protein